MDKWAEAVQRFAKERALAVIGKRDFGRLMSDTVQKQVSGDTAEVYVGDKNAFIAEHVHLGGPIRSRNGKPLAIPLNNASTAKWNPRRLFARELKTPLFMLKSKAGNKLLFAKPGKGEKLGPPLFALVDQTRPQRPRPWFPAQSEADAVSAEFFRKEFPQ